MNSIMSDETDGTAADQTLFDELRRHWWRWWRVGVAAATFGATVTAVAVSLRPRTWSAAIAFVPVSRGSSGVADLAAQAGGALGSLGSLAGLGGGGPRSPEFYAEVARSREIMWRVAEATYTDTVKGVPVTRTLTDWYGIKGEDPGVRRHRAIERLMRDVTPTVSRQTGVISVTVKASTATLAGQVATKLLEEVQRFIQETQHRQAEAELTFIQGRMQVARDDLERAEQQLEMFTTANREYRLSPQLTLERERLLRDIQLRQQVFVSLASSAEKARLDAVRDTPLLSVLQSPETPALPLPRGLVVLTTIGGLVCGIAGIFAAYIRDLLFSRPASVRGVHSGDAYASPS